MLRIYPIGFQFFIIDISLKNIYFANSSLYIHGEFFLIKMIYSKPFIMSRKKIMLNSIDISLF